MIGLGYERVDPGYRTLGAYYFNNDLRNITLNATTSLLANKMNVAASVGTQKNNLDKKETNQMNRYIGSVNVSYAPTNKLNLNASYSNFTTFTFIRSAFTTINQVVPVNNIDTLNYTQLSESATLGTSYLIGNTSKARRMAIVNISYQRATDKQGGEIQNTGSRFINGNFAYTQQYPALGLGVTLALNTNMSTAGDLRSSTTGPTVGISKSLLKKKMQTSATVSYNTQMINSERNNSITNVRLMAGYRVQNHHAFSLSGIILNRNSRAATSPDFTEYTVTLGYNYNF
jgi:cellobiose-specific phosphotransferase system component IIB